jgi:hypothetical protein
MPWATIARDEAIDHVVHLDDLPAALAQLVRTPILGRETS